MSILEIDKIDFITNDEENNEMVLTISDHLDWEDIEFHLLKLQDKVNIYLNYIESGQIFEDYSRATSTQSYKILIISKFNYPLEGIDFLKKVQQLVPEIAFEQRLARLKSGSN